MWKLGSVVSLAALAAALLLGGCAVKPDHAQIGPYPAEYRDLVKGHIDRTFFDPYTMRNVSISYPSQGHLFFRQGWLVCVEANAKNRFGAYTGLKRQVYLINEDRVINSMDGSRICSELALSPWPDMENRAQAN